ncbi:MAG: hypothetical protein PHW04_11315 [Candidatus Wallbacteria bacterium]|nr:hypothetical protein [Candidatus Wallbacteria bacterium]
MKKITVVLIISTLVLEIFYFRLKSTPAGESKKIEIRLAEIEDSIFHGYSEKPRLQYTELLNEFPENLSIRRSLIRSIPAETDPKSPLYSVSSSLFLARHTGGTLDKTAGEILTGALFEQSTSKDLLTEIIEVLAERCPEAVPVCRKYIADRNSKYRLPSYRLLKKMGALSETEEASCHYADLLTIHYGISSCEIIDAIAYFDRESGRPDWEKFKQTFASSSMDTVENIVPYEYLDGPASEVSRVLVSCFFPEIRKTLLYCFDQPEPKLRYNALKALKLANYQDLDFFKFHRVNLTYFNPACKSCSFQAYFKLHKISVDFFISQKNGPGSSEALKNLLDGNVFLTEIIAGLELEYLKPAEEALSYLNAGIREFPAQHK